jgi:hypothetical protein
MSCSRYALYYGGTAGAGNGVLAVTYRNCGDRTPTNLTVTGGTSGAFYGVVIASTDYDVPSLTCTTGYASAGGAPVGGFVYNIPVVPYATYVTTNSVSALSAHGLPYPTT